MKKQLNKIPQVLGSYSQAVVAGNFVFCSGQIAINPETGKFVGGTIGIQTNRVIENIKSILLSIGSDLDQVVKTEIFLKNISDFDSVNEVYSKYFFTNPKPARVTVEVSKLPKNALIEISCIAYKK